MKKRIVIVDDHVSIRDMLTWVLMRDTHYDIIGEAGSGIEALRLCGDCRPDLLILDLVLPCISGTEVLRRVRKDLPCTRVLIYSGTCNSLLIKQALRERPHGYVEKLEGLNILRQAISTIAGGGNYFSDSTRNLLCESRGGERPDLSRREREVLQLIAEGHSSKGISTMLSVALKTVENHRANLMAKLNLHDVASLTRYAARHGMVALE
ncbi:MAG TPA: response regulator transcription factor [Chthoniobacteraceae bacterium]|jgi:DNA-binding NarL/FixJ family response regulator|nr:response regulator transcription factor [Chthoniobacteraceae bacterium]